MNLYLVLALALGVTAPAAHVRVNTAAAEYKLPVRRAVVQFAVRSLSTGTSACATLLWQGHSCPCNPPLAGGSSPRAPAFSC